MRRALRAPTWVAFAIVACCAGGAEAESAAVGGRPPATVGGESRDAPRASSPTAFERERAAATAARIEREWPLRGGDQASVFVRALGHRLGDAAGPVGFRWQFTLVRDRSLNAFAIGNGRVYVSDGALARCGDEGELAALLAHEMGHQLAGHFASKEPPWVWGAVRSLLVPPADETRIGGVTQAHDPRKEREADAWSLQVLRRARYDPHAQLRLVRRLAGDPADRPTGEDDLAQRAKVLSELLRNVPNEGRTDTAAFRQLHDQLATELAIATPAVAPPTATPR